MSDVGLLLDRAAPGSGPIGAQGEDERTGLPPWTTTAGLAAGGLVLWYVCAAVFFPGGDTLPKPTSVVRALGEHREIWWPNTKATMIPAFKGLFIGVTIATVLATLTVLLPFLERPLLRVAVAVYSLPIVAIGPILQVSVAGDAPATALAALSVVFTTLVALAIGLRAVPPNSHDIAHALGARPLTYFLKVRVPSALPSFFSALRVAFPAAVIGAMIGEFMGAPRGLAVVLTSFVDRLETASTWATGLLITTITATGFAVIGRIGARVTRWIPPAVQTARAPATSSTWRRLSASVITLLVSAGALLVGWVGYLSLMNINSFVGKSPSDVRRFLTDPMFGDSRSDVYAALNRTLLDAGVGLFVGWVLAIGLACAFVLSPAVERVVMPIALAFRSVPILAVLPLLTLIFGRDLLGTVVIVLIIVFFPTLVLVLQALRDVPADLVAVAHVYNASSVTLLRKVRLPLALPSIFASLRIAAPAALLGALLAEWLATGKGMGYLMLSATTTSEYQQLWAGTVLMTTVAVLLYTAIDALERVVIGRFGPPAR